MLVLIDISVKKLIWDKTMGGGPYTAFQSADIKLDQADNVYITGRFRYTADFDPGPPVYNLTTFTGGFESDVFLARFDGDGGFVWAKAFGSYGEDYATGISVDNSGNVYSTGIFDGEVDFDPGLDKYTLTAIWGGGIFIHKMSPCLNRTSSTLNIAVCSSYTLNNITYDSSGVYQQILPNTSGCDSVITFNLLIKSSVTDLSVVACDSYTWQGKLLKASNVYYDTLKSTIGCDSILRLNLTIKSTSLFSVNASICEGESYNGYTLPGTYVDTFISTSGCDSIRTLHLTVGSKKYSTLATTICEGQSYLGRTTSGIYSDTLIAVNGCDSIRTVHLTVKPTAYGEVAQTICSGQEYLGYKFSGIYYDTLVAANGCDSIRKLNLVVAQPSFSTINKVICKGEQYLGHALTGSISDTLRTITGCDSVVTLHLTVVDLPKPDLGGDIEICTGDSVKLSPGIYQTYSWQNGSNQMQYVVKKAGIYTVTVSNSCGVGFDEIIVKEKSCKIYFPGAFTPNSDGRNDRFSILNPCNLRDFYLVIYNRFGQKVYESNDFQSGWDGMYNGLASDQGTYVWYCEFNEGGVAKSLKGTVVLLR